MAFRMPWQPKPLPPAPKPLIPHIPMPTGVLGVLAFGFISAVGAAAAGWLGEKLKTATEKRAAAQPAQQPQQSQYPRPTV